MTDIPKGCKFQAIIVKMLEIFGRPLVSIISHMIYLIGVEHITSQWKYPNGSNRHLVSSFTNSVRKYIKELNISAIAEELNEEVLREQQVGKSTAQNVSEEFHIRHIFCEPTIKERRALGIRSIIEISEQLFPNKPYWQMSEDSREQQRVNDELLKEFPIRESFWLNKIKHLERENILFICGKNHIQGFEDLLKKNNLKVAILSR